MFHYKSLILVVAALASFTFVFSQSPLAQGQGRGQGGPPAEAYKACAAHVAGDACEFDCPQQGHQIGTCQLRGSDALVCTPNHRPGQGGPRR